MLQKEGMHSQPCIGQGLKWNLFAQNCQFKAWSLVQLWTSVTYVLGGC
jgi:hypothetical protein